jgi:DNA-binding CsgD family transcriptional regulator
MEEFDPISVIEAAYRFDRSQREWMAGILEHILPIWDEGFGVGMFEVRIDEAGRPDIGEFAYAGADRGKFETMIRAMNASLDQEQIRESYQQPFVYATLSERLAPIHDDFRDDPVYQKYAHPVGIYDCRAAQIRDPSGTMYILAGACRHIRQTSARSRRVWERTVAHVAAADRLRRRGTAAHIESDDVDAVLDPQGRLLYVDLDNLDPDNHGDVLERAAEAIGRARGGIRRTDSERALELWQALIDGRYSLVEFRDSDGKDFLLARRNAPATEQPAGLDPRERLVVNYVVFGHSTELIAYELGLEAAVVRAALDSALTKLRLTSREQLVRLWNTLRAPKDVGQ